MMKDKNERTLAFKARKQNFVGQQLWPMRRLFDARKTWVREMKVAAWGHTMASPVKVTHREGLIAVFEARHRDRHGHVARTHRAMRDYFSAAKKVTAVRKDIVARAEAAWDGVGNPMRAIDTFDKHVERVLFGGEFP